MTAATLTAPATGFEFDTANWTPPATNLADDLNQGREPTADLTPESALVFSSESLFTLESDESSDGPSDGLSGRSVADELADLSPLPLPLPLPLPVVAHRIAASITATASPVPVPVPDYDAADIPSFPSVVTTTKAPTAEPPAPSPAPRLTKRQQLERQIADIEASILDHSKTEYDLAERLSQVRKWRKEALEELKAKEWELNAMGDEDGPQVDSCHKPCGIATNRVADTQPASPPTTPTIDHGGAKSLTALGVTPKQLEKFEIEGIRTVAQFEKALADRSIESVRGIQERTLDKLREALWEFRKQHPIPNPEDRPVQTASEGATMRRAEATADEAIDDPQSETEATAVEHFDLPAPNDYDRIREAGRIAGRSGLKLSENPIKDAPFRASYWDDGWHEGNAELQAASEPQGNAEAQPDTGSAPGPSPEPKKRPRRRKATTDESDATTATTNGDQVSNQVDETNAKSE